MKDDVWLDLPLTDAEIELLDDFLISGAVHDDSMDVSMMDGFITAVASGPNMLMPSAMLPWIWDAEHGKNAPRFASTSEARRITGLILRHWNGVNDSLNQTPDAYEPLLPEREVEGNTLSIIDEWCEGYCKGIEIDREAWDPLIASHPEWFTVIMLYGTPDGWAELERQRYSPEQHQAFALSLARFGQPYPPVLGRAAQTADRARRNARRDCCQPVAPARTENRPQRSMSVWIRPEIQALPRFGSSHG